jgi:hypothetical protein
MLLRRRTRSVLERSSKKGCNRSPSRLHTLRINATIKVARLIAGTRARVPRGRDGRPASLTWGTREMALWRDDWRLSRP